MEAASRLCRALAGSAATADQRASRDDASWPTAGRDGAGVAKLALRWAGASMSPTGWVGARCPHTGPHDLAEPPRKIGPGAMSLGHVSVSIADPLVSLKLPGADCCHPQ